MFHMTMSLLTRFSTDKQVGLIVCNALKFFHSISTILQILVCSQLFDLFICFLSRFLSVLVGT